MSEHLYILGHLIAHSKSPVMYNAVYERLGLPWHYEPADKATDAEARAFLEARDFLSVNITTPYKPHAFEAATHKAASAKLARGANLLVKHGEALLAFNTDGQGFVSFLERSGFDFLDKSIAICGTGPTALAILHACALAGADEVLLLSRDRAHSMDVMQVYVDDYGEMVTGSIDLPATKEHHRSLHEAYSATTFKFGSYSTSTQAIENADLVVNATPLGMNEGDSAPFDTALLREGQWVFDCVYGHGDTTLTAAACAASCVVFDGAGMLVAQAVASVEAVVDISGVDVDLSKLDLFELMAQAADFEVQ